MLVSIITSVLNGGATIEDTIRSVLSQTYKDIEYIVVDGRSTDGTLDTLEKYHDRIHKYISEPDKGIYDAMNKGIRLSTGDIVAVLNNDDAYAGENGLRLVSTQYTWDMAVERLVQIYERSLIKNK